MSRAYIVTGASGGLGRLIVERLLADGYYVLSSQRVRDTRNDPHETVFSGDLTSNLEKFLSYVTDYVKYMKSQGVVTCGLFNAIGIPARAASEADNSERINYEIPKRIAQHFASLVKSGSVVFLSSQHAVDRTKGKETYWQPKQKLEDAAMKLAADYPDLRINVILPGNLGIGMSAAKRPDYEKEGTLVDVGVIVDTCFKYLVSPDRTGQRIRVVAKGSITTVKKL